MYLGWFDDTRRPVETKIDEAVAAYVERFKTRPNIVLMSEADATPIRGMTARSESYIGRNNFWIGWEESCR
jgi:hypothetical protein